jgi:hypothetical protein
MRDFKEGDIVRWVGSSRFRRGGKWEVWFEDTGTDTSINAESVGTVYYANRQSYSVFVWGRQKKAPLFDQPSTCDNCPWVLATEETANEKV